jgi:hypothetical protein
LASTASVVSFSAARTPTSQPNISQLGNFSIVQNRSAGPSPGPNPSPEPNPNRNTSLGPNLSPNARTPADRPLSHAVTLWVMLWHYLYSMICCLIITGVLMDCYWDGGDDHLTSVIPHFSIEKYSVIPVENLWHMWLNNKLPPGWVKMECRKASGISVDHTMTVRLSKQI